MKLVPPESEYGALHVLVLQSAIDCGERTAGLVTTVMSHPAKLKGVFATVTLNLKVEPTANDPWLGG